MEKKSFKQRAAAVVRRIFAPKSIHFFWFPLALVLGADLHYRLNFSNPVGSFFGAIFGNFPAFLLILAGAFAAMFLLTALLGTSKRAKIAAVAVSLLFLLINDIKFSIMGLPLQVSDVDYLNPDNINMIGTATTTIGIWIVEVLIKTVVLAGLWLLFILWDRKGRTFRFAALKPRLIAAGLSAIVLVVPALLGGLGTKPILWIYGLTNEQCVSLPGTTQLYYEKGFYQGLFLNAVASNYIEPSDYDRDAIDQVIADAPVDMAAGEWGKANVVFILSEAFSDVQNMPEVEFKESLTPNLDAYAASSDKMVFDLLVPALGGTSVNTEFEILTGSDLALWTTNYIPYNSYYDEENAPYAPNIIKEFNANGYETMYLTPWGRDSYRSEYVYGLFEADRTVYGDQLTGEKKGLLYSDESLMNDIFEELKTTSEGNYKFIMAATAQNHFPYEKWRFPITDVVAESDSLTEEQLGLISSYAQGIYDADKALDMLYQKIRTLDTPTIIVFYGDHLPHIVDSKGEKPYLDSAYFNTESAELNEVRTYTTKAAILANFPLNASENPGHINSSYLGAFVLNKMDLQISDYFRYINFARVILPAYNKECAYIGGKVVLPADFSAQQQVTLQNLQFAKYRYFEDYED